MLPRGAPASVFSAATFLFPAGTSEPSATRVAVPKGNDGVRSGIVPAKSTGLSARNPASVRETPAGFPHRSTTLPSTAMPLDPAQPAASSPLSSHVMRDQLNALADRIVTLELALGGTARNPNLGTLNVALGRSADTRAVAVHPRPAQDAAESDPTGLRDCVISPRRLKEGPRNTRKDVKKKDGGIFPFAFFRVFRGPN